jgi:signal transduction histidine kinase
MRLFTKYSRVNIVASILALVLGSIGYFFTVRYVLVHELDDTLRIEEAEILDNVRRRDRLPEPANYVDQQIQYNPSAREVARKFRQTTWGDLVATAGKPPGARNHDPGHPFRELVFSIRAQGQLYTVSIAKSEEETEDLLTLIMLVTAGMVVILLGVLFLANRLLLRRIWQPFYRTLDNIRAFNLSSREPLPVTNTDIEEFRSLDLAARQMTGKIIKDYEVLKNFADNASHEMQTPLAVINSKLDLLIQDIGIHEAHHRPVQAMYDAIGRLRQLNQSLLLLTKIENNQFADTRSIDLALLIGEKLIQLEDPLKDRHLQVHTELDPLPLPINGYLADILLNNLLTNAIRHNHNGGKIDIRLVERRLRISNSGPELGFEAATIFDRFVKGMHSGGSGLGLAIVRQICDNYRFPLQYGFKEGVHTIEIEFLN